MWGKVEKYLYFWVYTKKPQGRFRTVALDQIVSEQYRRNQIGGYLIKFFYLLEEDVETCGAISFVIPCLSGSPSPLCENNNVE